jgi:hypothetical protein
VYLQLLTQQLSATHAALTVVEGGSRIRKKNRRSYCLTTADSVIYFALEFQAVFRFADCQKSILNILPT